MCNERVLAEYEMPRFFEKIQGPKVTIVLKFSTIKFIDEKVDYHWNKIDTKCTEKKIEKQNKIKKYRFLNFPSQITKLLMFKNSRSFSITIMDKELF